MSVMSYTPTGLLVSVVMYNTQPIAPVANAYTWQRRTVDGV